MTTEKKAKSNTYGMASIANAIAMGLKHQHFVSVFQQSDDEKILIMASNKLSTYISR
jgi:hypothetical protein